MEPNSYIVIFITTKDAEEAEKISKALVKRRLAACVSTVPEVSSRFWWKDKLDNAKESLLVVKTKDSLLPEIIKSVKKIHSYSVPEIIALPIVGGNPDYLDWIRQRGDLKPQSCKSEKYDRQIMIPGIWAEGQSAEKGRLSPGRRPGLAATIYLAAAGIGTPACRR
jgi:periplasmic divalent cation tolerance protein